MALHAFFECSSQLLGKVIPCKKARQLPDLGGGARFLYAFLSGWTLGDADTQGPIADFVALSSWSIHVLHVRFGPTLF